MTATRIIMKTPDGDAEARQISQVQWQIIFPTGGELFLGSHREVVDRMRQRIKADYPDFKTEA